MLAALAATLVYAAMGLALLGLGVVVLDAITPGRLGRLVMGDDGTPPSMNAGVLAAASLVATALVVFTALWTNVRDGLGAAVLWTLVFGVVGIALQALAVKLVDWLTPGDLATVVLAAERLHPATVVAAATQLAVAAVVVASIA